MVKHPNRELKHLLSDTCARFAVEFGCIPDVLVVAPGRVNLIGEHVDYNQGIVLPLAVERYTVVAMSRRADSLVTVHSLVLRERPQLDLRSIPELPWAGRHWLGYVAGSLYEVQSCPVNPIGFDIVIDTNLPLGGGLSSSASLTVALVRGVNELLQLKKDWQTLAAHCQEVERKYLGVPCGLMDPWACLACERDFLLKIDFADFSIQHIPWLNDELAFLIVNSGVHHALSDGRYAARRRSCETAADQLGVVSLRDIQQSDFAIRRDQLERTVAKRAEHVIDEIARAHQAVAAVNEQQWDRLGELMNASHQSLKDLFEVSCNELDCLVTIARKLPGVLGARLTGGGFGGSTINLVEQAQVAEISQSIKTAYHQQTGITPEIFSTRPAAGCQVVESINN